MERPSSEIGVGLVTYNRPEYYSQVLKNIPRNEIGFLTIVNDGDNSYVNSIDGDNVITNNKQLGVSKSKNILIKDLVDRGYEHIFIIEDDILIKDPKVFQHYIKAAQSTGIHHLCFEKIADNGKNLKYSLTQPDGVQIGFYHNPQGAFMYINANLIKKLGYFDENYTNAFEHIDFAYNLINNKVAPPFWYFPDLLNSEKYLTDINGSNENSSITNKENYQNNWDKSAQYFIKKWGHFTNSITDKGEINLQSELIKLQNNYSRKKLVNEGKKLSIVIPYRDRGNALKNIVPSLQNYVSKQVSDFEIIIMEQDNKDPFNKGLLNNIGFTKCTGDYVCFHDVDLIPEIADYSYPTNPTHMSSHCSQFNYINIPDKIMGGVILFTREHYKRVNGYSNEFVGWGKEDDDLYERCMKEKLIPYKHPFGKFFSIPHVHRLSDPVENELHLKNGDRFRSYSEGKLGKNYHKKDGLNSIPYVTTTNENIEGNVSHYKVSFL
jgi:GT2 family glycosyltransferase